MEESKAESGSSGSSTGDLKQRELALAERERAMKEWEEQRERQ